ncbi:MAG: hypothetical protein AB7N76_04770 [Planctomycetota bacterium]
MDEKVFIYLRLTMGDTVLARSKIREFAGLGSLLAQFLHRTLRDGVELPPELEAEGGSVPALDYVDANTGDVLIRFRVDPVERVQVVEGRIPPPYQGRMLDPDATAISLSRFQEVAAEEGMNEEQRRVLSDRLAKSQIGVLTQIRETIDEEGRFRVQVPLP